MFRPDWLPAESLAGSERLRERFQVVWRYSETSTIECEYIHMYRAVAECTDVGASVDRTWQCAQQRDGIHSGVGESV